MTVEEKKIKLADQAASLLCNLTMANDPAKFSITKERNFYDKAHALGVAIVQAAHAAGEHLALDGWESFFGRVLLQNQSLFDIPQGMSAAAIQSMRDHVRARFDFDHLMDSTSDVSIVPERARVAHYLDLHMPSDAASTMPQVGVVRVGFNQQGRVASYVMWAAHAGGEDHEANSMQVRFTKALRERRRQFNRWMDGGEVAVRGLLQPGEPINVTTLEGEVRGTGRMYYVSPPLPATAFISAVRQAGACTRDDIDRIEATGAKLELAYDGRPRIPTRSVIRP